MFVTDNWIKILLKYQKKKVEKFVLSVFDFEFYDS